MRSCCSGVSGGNESTMARTCSASTAAGCGAAGSVMLGDGPGAVRTGCLGKGAAMRMSWWRRYPVLSGLVGHAQRSFVSSWC